ncbi:MAG TPA: CUB domain-containing protein, partial [Flavobacterium sp.]|nr:CUB domain-containing protein [Flavobacterium sp.]
MNSNTPVNSCAGIFYDSGGQAGNYSNSQTFTKTFCPTTPGSGIRLNFTTFSLGAGDTMAIYNGNSTAAPLYGTYSGSDGPGIIQANTSNPTGCLTVVFTSDGSGISTGWSATISCITPCQTINAVLVSSSPAANPSDNIIKICQNTS